MIGAALTHLTHGLTDPLTHGQAGTFFSGPARRATLDQVMRFFANGGLAAK